MFNIKNGYEPQTSGIGSDYSANWATTTAPYPGTFCHGILLLEGEIDWKWPFICTLKFEFYETENSTSAIMIFCSDTFHENFANILHRTLHALRHVASALHFQHFYVKMFNPKRAATSVTRLGDFWKWKILVKIFLTTVAQILGHFLGSNKT